MKKWNDMSIGLKYGFIFGIVVILFGISALISFNMLKAVEEEFGAYDRRSDRSIMVTQLGSRFRTKDIRISDYILFEDEKYISQYEEIRRSFEEIQQIVEPRLDTEKQKELIATIDENDTLVSNIFENEIIPAVRQGDKEKALSLRSEVADIRSETIDSLQHLRTLVNSERDFAQETAFSIIDRTVLILISSVLISAILGVILIILVSRYVKSRLNKVVAVTSKVAEGDLRTEKLDFTGKDEVGRLSEAVNTMLVNLRNIIGQVVDGSDQVAASSEELSASGEQVGESAGEVSGAIQDVASGAEEQSSQVD